MTRVIKARALGDRHVGRLVSHHGCPEPERLHGVTTSLTFAYLTWARGVATSVPLDADITIHD